MPVTISGAEARVAPAASGAPALGGDLHWPLLCDPCWLRLSASEQCCLLAFGGWGLPPPHGSGLWCQRLGFECWNLSEPWIPPVECGNVSTHFVGGFVSV